MIRVLQGDCREVLKRLPDRSVHCVVTSPPYFGLREYGTATWEGGISECDHVIGEIRTGLGMAKLGERYAGGGHKASEPKPMFAKAECPKCGAVRVDKQIGLEATPDAYVAQLVAVFREARRVLRDDGVVWLNLGDSYARNPAKGQHKAGDAGKQDYIVARGNRRAASMFSSADLGDKQLLMIPARVALALQADGWYLRSDVIWHKPNPMPESVTDRPTSSHEHVFLLTKAARYFYDADAVREESEPSSLARAGIMRKPSAKELAHVADGHWNGAPGESGKEYGIGRNLRNVWTIATTPYAEAHFATFPPELAERCIKAGTSEKGCCPSCGASWQRIIIKGEPDEAHRAACGADTSGGYNGQSTKDHDAHGVQNASDVKRRILEGLRLKTYDWAPTCDCPEAAPVPCTVLDPFSGAGTTAMVADRLGRDAIGIELNADYARMTRNRITADAGMFAEIAS